MTPRALATDRSLAAFHAARAELYEAFVELLGRGRRGARAERGVALAGDEALVALLAAAAPDALAAERRAFAGRRSLERGRTRALVLLAALAGRTAAALRAGDLVAAARLSEAQGRFLRERAAPRLAVYAADLEASGAPLHAALGRALARSVARDATLH